MTILTELSWNESPMTCLLLLTLPKVQKEEQNSAVGVEKKKKTKQEQEPKLSLEDLLASEENFLILTFEWQNSGTSDQFHSL